MARCFSSHGLRQPNSLINQLISKCRVLFFPSPLESPLTISLNIAYLTTCLFVSLLGKVMYFKGFVSRYFIRIIQSVSLVPNKFRYSTLDRLHHLTNALKIIIFCICSHDILSNSLHDKKYALCHLPNNFFYETEITDLYDYHGDCIVTFTCNKHWF